MKKFLSILLAALLMTAVFAVATGAMLGRTYHGEIPMLTDHRNEIRLDGVREELYANAVEVPINRWRSGSTDNSGYIAHTGLADPGKKTDSGDPNDPTTIYADGTTREVLSLAGQVVTEAGVATGSSWTVYDGEYLWIYVEVTDDDLESPLGGVQNAGNYWKSDSVEIRINWKNNNVVGDVYNAGINYEGYLTGGKKGAGGKGTIDQGDATPCTWLEAYTVKTDVGYNVEARIDLTPFEAEIAEGGGNVAINFTLNDCKKDCDTSTRLVISAEHGGGGDWYPGTYGYMKFNYAAQPTTGDMTVIYVVIAMVSALAIGGASVIVLKRKATAK